jgi:sigma-E factor negative regulatory protein RseC
VGEEVTIVGTIGMGMNAVLWAYVVPLLLLIVALSLAICFIHSEPLSALIAVGVLFIYYLALYFNRNRLSKKFSFNIKPLNQ